MVSLIIYENGIPVSYCWTHGITHNLCHQSKLCQRKAEYHKDESNFTNQLGVCRNDTRINPMDDTPGTEGALQQASMIY